MFWSWLTSPAFRKRLWLLNMARKDAPGESYVNVINRARAYGEAIALRLGV